MRSSDWLAAVLVRDSDCEPAPGESASGCDVPGGAVVFEAEVDQSFEVDDGSSSGERDAVAVDAAVTQKNVFLIKGTQFRFGPDSGPRDADGYPDTMDPDFLTKK